MKRAARKGLSIGRRDIERGKGEMGRPLKRGLIDGSGPGKGGGNYLLFLPVSHRFSPLLGKDQVFPAGVMPDHPSVKKECSRKYQNRRNHGGRYSLRQNS
ncbi:hypothetical protein [Akkermansia sp.]|uniref:hypothetical protein n=1 Tax=Akkermansia sp. TaxID=1872421 RepID=UPI003AB0D5AD